jgi:hypothetical protein
MKKMIVMLYICLPSFVYSQSGVGSDCNLNLENIFKVQYLKIRYETVQYIYETKKKGSFGFPRNSEYLNRCYEIITGSPLYLEKQNDSISGVNHGELVEVKWMSEEEVNRYIEQLNCTPEKAFEEYKAIIQNIKSQKALYSKCLDAELAKGDSSEYAKENMSPYGFLPPMQSVIHLPVSITKLDFLKVFKEFVFNDNEDVLPDGVRVYAYLKCNCKIP